MQVGVTQYGNTGTFGFAMAVSVQHWTTSRLAMYRTPAGMGPGSACDIDAASRLGTMKGRAECFISYNACAKSVYPRECWLACAVCSKLSTPGRYLLSVILWLVQNTISVGFPIQLQYCRGSRQVKATGMM